MTAEETTLKFKQYLEESLAENTFVKISMGNYKGEELDLKQIVVRKVLIKNEQRLGFTFRFKTRDVTKNFEVKEGGRIIEEYLSNGFKIATLFTTHRDFIVEELNNGKTVLRTGEPTNKIMGEGMHDRPKRRIIEATCSSYLTELRITDQDGKVFKNAQDKFRQINHYIEILSSLIKELPEGNIRKVVDMGSGKGYLTFALYDYLHHVLKLDTEVIGVEYRQDLVDLCNVVAKKSEFDRLHFVQGTIEEYDADQVNLLIALHACDTATDDAIFKGIKAGAELIVVAPCCHKQIRKEMERNKTRNEVSFLTKYGIFLERQAEMVTDGIRALILEYFGYKTKVFEFVSDAHTPKNVLVVGIKNKDKGAKNKGQGAKSNDEILEKIKASKEYFGIGYHHLERLMEL